MVDKILHRKLRIEQHKPNRITGVNSGYYKCIHVIKQNIIWLELRRVLKLISTIILFLTLTKLYFALSHECIY
jgi:hypothetical protein